MGYASRVMRGLIIDHARSRSAQKRGGQFEITSSVEGVEQPADPVELEQLGAALDELGEVDPCLAEVVDMKFFCGFTFAEISAVKKYRSEPCSASGRRPASTCIANSAESSRLTDSCPL